MQLWLVLGVSRFSRIVQMGWELNHSTTNYSRWWCFKYFYFHPDPWGNDPIWLVHIFQMGWWTNHQLLVTLSSHKSHKHLVDLEAVNWKVHDFQKKHHLENHRNSYHFFWGNWKYGFRGFQLMEISELQRLFSRHTFFHWMMIPSLYLANAWKSQTANICLKTGCLYVCGFFFRQLSLRILDMFFGVGIILHYPG